MTVAESVKSAFGLADSRKSQLPIGGPQPRATRNRGRHTRNEALTFTLSCLPPGDVGRSLADPVPGLVCQPAHPAEPVPTGRVLLAVEVRGMK